MTCLLQCNALADGVQKLGKKPNTPKDTRHADILESLSLDALLSGGQALLALGHALPCRSLPCLAFLCLALPFLAGPCLALPFLALPFGSLPCLFFSRGHPTT